MNLSSANVILAGILCLLGVGFYGLLATRNLIKVIVALQILVKAVLLAIILAGSLRGQIDGQMATSQSLALTVIVADTIVAVIGLAMAVQIRRHIGTLDVGALAKLRR